MKYFLKIVKSSWIFLWENILYTGRISVKDDMTLQIVITKAVYLLVIVLEKTIGNIYMKLEKYWSQEESLQSTSLFKWNE